jgi:putative protease
MVKKKTVRKASKAKRPARKPARKAGAGKRAGHKRSAARSKKASVAKPALPESVLEKIGKVTHYFPHVNAAAVKLLKSGLRVGDEIYLKGHTTDFKERVESIQLDHTPIAEGRKGQEIGLLVKSRVRIGDSVYRI